MLVRAPLAAVYERNATGEHSVCEASCSALFAVQLPVCAWQVVPMVDLIRGWNSDRLYVNWQGSAGARCSPWARIPKCAVGRRVPVQKCREEVAKGIRVLQDLIGG